MEQHKQILRLGAAAVVFAVVLRLTGAGFFSPVGEFLQSPRALSFLIYLQTGRVVRYSESSQQPSVQPPVEQPQEEKPPAQQMGQQEQESQLPVFTEDDLEAVSITYGCSYRPDLQKLITQQQKWTLAGDGPKVLIVHTHATEGYQKQPGQTYEEYGAYRTLDDRYNMVSIGDEVARVLEAGGVEVLHDRSYHDYPSYNGSYGNARVSIEEYLRKYPTIEMVLDIHRDASDGADGKQLTTSAVVGGQKSSQLMVVVGTNASGNYHPGWQDNLSAALQLSAMLERQNPGITRPISLRSERFNMDLTKASLLIEVGGAGDTHDQAILAANALARGLLALKG